MVTLSHGELLLPAAAFCFHICTLPLIWSCGIEADDAAARTQDCKRPFADRRRAVQRRPNGPRPAVCPAEPVCRAMPERQRQALPSAKPPCGPRCRHIQTAHGRLTGRRIGTRRLPAPILFALAARLSLSGQICTAGCRGGRLCPPVCPVGTGVPNLRQHRNRCFADPLFLPCQKKWAKRGAGCESDCTAVPQNEPVKEHRGQHTKRFLQSYTTAPPAWRQRSHREQLLRKGMEKHAAVECRTHLRICR